MYVFLLDILVIKILLWIRKYEKFNLINKTEKKYLKYQTFV